MKIWSHKISLDPIRKKATFLEKGFLKIKNKIWDSQKIVWDSQKKNHEILKIYFCLKKIKNFQWEKFEKTWDFENSWDFIKYTFENSTRHVLLESTKF